MLVIENGAVVLGDRRVLEAVSHNFMPGTVTAILGPNGAGKSTLLRALCGLVPLAQGRVFIAGDPLAGLGRREVARRVGYVPQGVELAFPLPVEEVVAMGRYAHQRRFHGESAEDLMAVRSALERTATQELAGRLVNELSGGERQRVLVARALAARAPALLLDEPIANLDVRHAFELLEILRAEAQAGKTVVVALHDLNLAARYAQRFVLLREGRVLVAGGAEEVLRPEQLRAAFGVAAQACESAGNVRHFVFSKLG